MKIAVLMPRAENLKEKLLYLKIAEIWKLPIWKIWDNQKSIQTKMRQASWSKYCNIRLKILSHWIWHCVLGKPLKKKNFFFAELISLKATSDILNASQIFRNLP